jgi:hypothetical protein
MCLDAYPIECMISFIRLSIKILCLSVLAIALSHDCRFSSQKYLDTRLSYDVPEDSSGSTLR